MTLSEDRRRRIRSTRGRVLIATAVTGSALAAVVIAFGGALYAIAYVAALPPRRLARAGRRRAADWQPVRPAQRAGVTGGAPTLAGSLVVGALLTAGASVAVAHLNGTANSSVATATPISTGTTYSGQFVGSEDAD